MKIFSSLQKACEKRVNFYASQLERAEEKEKLEHMVQVGALLLENKAEIEAYTAWRQGKSIPADTAVTDPAGTV